MFIEIELFICGCGRRISLYENFWKTKYVISFARNCVIEKWCFARNCVIEKWCFYESFAVSKINKTRVRTSLNYKYRSYGI